MADLMKLQGFKELADAMRQLPGDVAKNALRSAVNAGASEIRKEARVKAPRDTGRLKKSIYQKQIREQSSQYKQIFYVGVRSGVKRGIDGKKDYSRDAWYWKFIEFGTSKLPAKPFLRPAFEAKKQAAVLAIGEKLDQRIQKAARELSRK